MKDLEVQIVWSRRKTLALEIRPDTSLLVRAPFAVSEAQIRKFLMDHENWIRKHLSDAKRKAARQEPAEKLSMDEIRSLADQALRVIPERAAYYAPLIGVTYGKITIRNQRSRWGSCSSKGNLNFNCLLMLAPLEVVDSVVVHELCHRKEMNHSERFYKEVYRVFPEYDKWNRWLKENGAAIMRRMTG